MSVNLKLEKFEDADMVAKFEEVNLKEIEFYTWQRHAVNQILQMTKYLIPETNQIFVSVFAESGAYIPTHEEIMAIKNHFMPAKIATIKMEYGVAGDDKLIIPINVEILEWVKIEPKTKILSHSKTIVDLQGKALVN